MIEQFAWVSAEARPPACWDLRHLGWRMQAVTADSKGPDGLPWMLDCRDGARSHDWRQLPGLHWIAAVGVEDGAERIRMLEAGMGEALPMRVAIGELSVRLARMVARSASLPRRRMAGPMQLDLFHRDARFADRWLGLHPREFALLWRLAEQPGERVDRCRLLADVWRLDHMPETNSLEVHVSRLRSELAVWHLDRLVETDARGGYRLARAIGPHASPPCDRSLDSLAAIGKGARRMQTIGSEAHAME